ncbi:MAG: CoA transferase [Chloroflexota bacterium]|nr:CoA transferase [Chloroflexota bacterium]
MLDGLKVLDLTHYVAGPYATRLMAAQGADVVKVERPGVGDPSRRIGPFPDDVPHREKSALYLYLNTGKKSITLDLKHGASKPILRHLLQWADVLVENFRPGVMQRLGLDYDTVSDINPRIVMTSVSNFGQTGPYRDYGAREINLYAMGGLMYITGDAEREPLGMAARLAQYGAGQNAFAGTLGALLHRDISGIGQHVDVAISEYLATILENALSQYSYTGSNFRRTGNRGYGRAAWGPYPCRDGYVGVIAGPDHNWPEMSELMGIAELAADRFGDRAGRGENADELDALMLPWLMSHDRHDIFERAQRRGLAFAYVATPQDILSWEHLRERSFFAQVEHANAVTVEHPTLPWLVDGERSANTTAAPTLGQHNGVVYMDMLGYSKPELVRLRGMGAV